MKNVHIAGTRITSPTCSYTDCRSAFLAFQKSISTIGPGFLPSRRGCAELFLRTSLIWWDHSITTLSTVWMTLLSKGRPLQNNTNPCCFPFCLKQFKDAETIYTPCVHYGTHAHNSVPVHNTMMKDVCACSGAHGCHSLLFLFHGLHHCV